MGRNFRFAIVSDLHIALPHTIWDHPSRFHLVEYSIPVFEEILTHLSQVDLDFLVLPGDLTQHGEPENHAWLVQRLAKLPYPVYVIPGNHDLPDRDGHATAIAPMDFPVLYRDFGYTQTDRLYYSVSPLPEVRLIGLNSIQFDETGEQRGAIDPEQVDWLDRTLSESSEALKWVTIHHNVLEHIPDQLHHPLGKRYILENPGDLLAVLHRHGVQLIFTGHLHIQDIAESRGIYDITTGSLVSYPHPYRIVEFRTSPTGQSWLHIESPRIRAIPEHPTLLDMSYQWMSDRSISFILKLLTQPPLNLSLAEAKDLAPHLQEFWTGIADGDRLFDYPHLPEPARGYFESFGARDRHGRPQLIDNAIALRL